MLIRCKNCFQISRPSEGFVSSFLAFSFHSRWLDRLAKLKHNCPLTWPTHTTEHCSSLIHNPTRKQTQYPSIFLSVTQSLFLPQYSFSHTPTISLCNTISLSLSLSHSLSLLHTLSLSQSHNLCLSLCRYLFHTLFPSYTHYLSLSSFVPSYAVSSFVRSSNSLIRKDAISCFQTFLNVSVCRCRCCCWAVGLLGLPPPARPENESLKHSSKREL